MKNFAVPLSLTISADYNVAARNEFTQKMSKLGYKICKVANVQENRNDRFVFHFQIGTGAKATQYKSIVAKA